MRHRSLLRQGSKRLSNEDGLLCLEERGLYVVCDGVGAGADAASEVIDSFRLVFQDASLSELDSARSLLDKAFQRSNRRLQERAMRSGKSSCASVLAILIRNGFLHTAWCGDCRLYGPGGLLTNDHTRLQELVKRGIVTENEIDEDLRKSALTRCLGSREEASVEHLEAIRLETPCCFLLCTDGVSDIVDEAHIRQMLRGPGSAESITTALKGIIEEKNAEDDTALVCVLIEEHDCQTTVRDKRTAATGGKQNNSRGKSVATALDKPVGGGRTSLLSYLLSLPRASGREIAIEMLTLGAAFLFSFLLPGIIESAGKRLGDIPMGYWTIPALLLYLLILKLRLR